MKMGLIDTPKAPLEHDFLAYNIKWVTRQLPGESWGSQLP